MILIMAIACMGFADDFMETTHEQNSAEDKDIYIEPKEQKKDYKDDGKRENIEDKAKEPVKSDAEQALYDSDMDLHENEETAIWGSIGMLSTCLIGGIVPAFVMIALDPIAARTAPMFSCSAMPLVTILTTVAISFIKVPFKENEKYLNSNDTYKSIYRENYLRKAKRDRIKYSIYGGVLANIINLLLALISIGLILLSGYLSS